ncbi:MAG: hypothetical protein WD011_03455, partial [Nitriliruptoraceae bacterium]
VVIVPEDDDEAAAPDGDAASSHRDASFWLGVVLLIVGALWLFGGPLSPVHRFGGILGPDTVLALVLIGFGVALWRRSERQRDDTPMPVHRADDDPPAPHAPEISATAGRSEPAEPAPPPGAPTSEPAQHFAPPPVPTRERSVLGRVTLGTVFVVVGGLWLLRIADVVHVAPRHLLATALLVVGLGLLVGAFAGRARWLILVGILLLPLVLAGALVRAMPGPLPHIRVEDGAGDVRVTPGDASELREEYRLGGGRFELDLRNLTLDEPTDVDIEVGAGEVVVRFPEDVTAVVDVSIGVGQVRVDGRADGGLGLDRTYDVSTGAGSATVTIDVELGAGQLDIRTADALLPSRFAPRVDRRAGMFAGDRDSLRRLGTSAPAPTEEF